MAFVEHQGEDIIVNLIWQGHSQLVIIFSLIYIYTHPYIHSPFPFMQYIFHARWQITYHYQSHMAASSTYHLQSPSCSKQAIQKKSLSLTVLSLIISIYASLVCTWFHYHQNLDHNQIQFGCKVVCVAHRKQD